MRSDYTFEQRVDEHGYTVTIRHGREQEWIGSTHSTTIRRAMAGALAIQASDDAQRARAEGEEPNVGS